MMILVYIKDIFFIARLKETAKHTGAKLKFLDNSKGFLDDLEKASSIIVDLEIEDAVETLRKTRNLKQYIPITGYCSHVNKNLMDKAKEYCTVMPRSEFSRKLPDILRVN